MKNKLFISGLLLFISLLTTSCTNDDYEIPETNNSSLKVMSKEELKMNLNKKMDSKVKDSINETNVSKSNVTVETEGDPIIVIPPRKN
ncbi:hypothetical protein LNQ49_02875 [Flavobacterium sp. F-65]|jgi:hypothetical protein|uniref:Lipoprotein n=1 Tax=Flavobacterium pisciphilum TaxID=2893755 RepID=A0ABS8MPH3_9FLAO|nr:hypothetical protein [Flavobacterium sp. F-65]MCC9070543.1 hypothetical protein [Flavobacterium sp. F-65]